MSSAQISSAENRRGGWSGSLFSALLLVIHRSLFMTDRPDEWVIAVHFGVPVPALRRSPKNSGDFIVWRSRHADGIAATDGRFWNGGANGDFRWGNWPRCGGIDTCLCRNLWNLELAGFQRYERWKLLAMCFCFNFDSFAKRNLDMAIKITKRTSIRLFLLLCRIEFYHCFGNADFFKN